MTDRIEELKAQVNALAQAWLYLAAMLETQGCLEPQRLDQALRDVSWADAAVDEEGQRALGWLADQLESARQARRGQGQPAGGLSDCAQLPA